MHKKKKRFSRTSSEKKGSSYLMSVNMSGYLFCVEWMLSPGCDRVDSQLRF